MFAKRGVVPTAMFDVDPALIGTTVGELPVLSMEELEHYLAANPTDIAVLTLPKDCAAEARAAAGRRPACPACGISPAASSI